MKKFHYHKNRLFGSETMTAAELIARLQTYPPDMPVIAEYEGVHAAIKLGDEYFEIAKDFHMGYEQDACDVLVICVDVNS